MNLERKQALKRLEYDVNVIEKEGRKLAKEYEKVLSINLDEILDDPKAAKTVQEDNTKKNHNNSSTTSIMEETVLVKKETIAATTETEDYEEEIYTLHCPLSQDYHTCISHSYRRAFSHC